MQKRLTLIPCLLLPFFLLAQQNTGIRTSNYSGIQGALLNPASIADSKLKWDVNALSVGTNFDNTFVYIPKGAVPAFGFKSIIEGIIHENKFGTHFDPQDPNKLYNLTLSTEILGPSFQLQLPGPGNQAIGLTIASRSYANIRNIPGHVAQSAYDFLLNQGLWNTPFSDHSSQLEGMSWLEYGLHYGAVLFNDGTTEWKAGISLKYLQGVGAAYVKNTNLNYSIGDTTHLLFANSSVDYGRTDYDTYRKISGYGDLNHGHGLGADLGVQFEHLGGPKEGAGYLYKIGLSLLDIGRIKFNRNATAYHLQTAGADFSDWRGVHLTSNIQVDRTLSAVFYNGDSSASKVGDQFTMGLPTSLSLQGDWNFCENFFINATIVKGFGHGNGQGVRQPDIYSVTPRYESKWWDVSLPLSLLYYGHWRPRVGLAVRAGYFFFGGDAPAGLLALGNLQGVDFYAGVHFFVLQKKDNKASNN
ncbi:MAG TPA: DUF5723 family protein [Puia sp.]|jgi:hypothetical protein